MNSPPPLPPPFDPSKVLQPAWRQGVIWLNQCHVLTPEANRILNYPSSTIEDFANELADGILLCNLLNFLVPGVIKYTDVSFRPQRSRFLCLQNIRLFLETCRREFNFRERDLFDPYMLFDKYDLDKVVETLSKLSRTEAAKRKKLLPFPMTGPVNYANMPPSQDDNNDFMSVIRSLDDTVPIQKPSMLQRQSSLCHSCRYARIHHVPSFLSPTFRTDSSIIDMTTNSSNLSSTNLTESLSSSSLVAACAASTLSSATATTAGSSNGDLPSSHHRLSTSSLPFTLSNGDSGVYGSRISIADDVYEQLCEKPKKSDNQKACLPRDHCVKELLDTELNYRDSLNQIVTHFIDQLQLKPDERKKIFLNISEIHALHSKFYEDLCLAGRNEKGRTSRIVDLFTQWQDRFLIYAKYCSELPDAQEFLDRKIKQDPTFAQKLEQCRQRAGDLGKFQLRDTVVLPFQRIVKYSLLLHTMKKNVPPTDPNGDAKRQLLEKAERLMTDVNQFINEAKRAYDNLKVISNIEKTICDIKLPSNQCLRNYGRFISDEQFLVFDDGHRNGTRTVFLFDRVLLICKIKGSEKYTFRAALFIQGCQVEELKAAKREFPFVIRDNLKHEYKFVAKTEEKRTDWLKHLREAIDRCSSPELFENGHHFQMKTFDEPHPRCEHCDRYLCGIFYQGYECIRCRQRLHRECIRKTGPCVPRASLGRMRSFDRGSIELPRAFSNISNGHHNRVYALFDYDGSLNSSNNKFQINRHTDRLIKVNEGDELDVLEDDDEHMWKVKNLRTNEVGLIPATLVGVIDGDLSKTIQRSSTTLAETSSVVCDCETWYLDISRYQAEDILRNESIPNNTFLVRKQGRNEGHAISIRHNDEIYHIRIYTQEVDGAMKHYLVDGLLFDSLQSLIQYYQIHSLEDRFPPVKSSLVHPIARVCNLDILSSGTL